MTTLTTWLRSARQSLFLGRIGLCLLALLAIQNAGASEQWITSTIKGVYTLASGDFILVFNAQSSAPNCNAQNQYFQVSAGQNGMSSDGVKLQLANSLAAAAQHQTVQVAFDNVNTNCAVNRIWVSY